MSIQDWHNEILKHQKPNRLYYHNTVRLPDEFSEYADFKDERLDDYQKYIKAPTTRFFYCELANSTPYEYDSMNHKRYNQLVNKIQDGDIVYNDRQLCHLSEIAVGAPVDYGMTRILHPYDMAGYVLGVVVDACVQRVCEEDSEYKRLAVVFALFERNGTKDWLNSESFHTTYCATIMKSTCPICGNVSYFNLKDFSSCKCKPSYEQVDVDKIEYLYMER